jgi:hypothetical protein
VDTSLRFYGNASSAVDRVKIPIDDPNRDNPGPMMDLGSSDFVLEWWMKAEPGDNNAADTTCGANNAWAAGNFIFDRTSSFGKAQWGVSMLAGKIAFGVTDGNNVSYTICSTSTVDDGQWHHIAIQRNRYPNSQGLYEDGQLWLFIDGVMEATGVGPIGRISYDDGTPPGTTCGPSGTEICKDDSYLVVGGGKNDQGLPYKGWIDDIRTSAWLRYFTDFAAPTAPHAIDNDTVALLRLDSGSGNVVYDTGGYDGGTSNGWLYMGGSPAGPAWSSENPFTAPPTTTPTSVTFAVIGDYGTTSQAAADVGTLVNGWNPDLVITTGDNNYPDGAAATIDDNIGQLPGQSRLGHAQRPTLSRLLHPPGQRALLRLRLGPGALLRRRQRSQRTGRHLEHFHAGAVVASRPGRFYGTLEGRLPAPCPLFLLQQPWFHHRAAVALRGLGRRRCTRRA